MFQLLMTYQINISYETDLKAYLITKCADIIPGTEKQKKTASSMWMLEWWERKTQTWVSSNKLI